MWKLWITFRICMAIQYYGNCFMMLQMPETLANSQVIPPTEPLPG